MKRFVMAAFTAAVLTVGLTPAQASRTIDTHSASETQRRENYINDGQAKLQKWQSNIDELQGKVATGPSAEKMAGAEKSVEQRNSSMGKSLEELKADFSKARSHLEGLRSASSDRVWKEQQAMFESELRRMDASYSHANSLAE
jgi:TolA-binding protein